MKRAVTILLLIGLVAATFAMPAEAKKKKKKVAAPARVERVVQGAYDAPALIVVGACAQTGAIGCVSIQTGPGETYLKAKINDSHGQPAYVAISADSNGDSQDDTSYGSFCGETAEPIAFDPGVELHLWVGLQADPGFVGCAPGVATNGTISVTLSNMP